MKKHSVILNIFLFIFASVVLFTSCSDDDLGNSIIDTPAVSTDPLDIWINQTYTTPFNINVQYKWNSVDSDITKDLVPPRKELVQDFLKAVYKIWLYPYTEVTDLGPEFMKRYSCRELKLIGSGGWNSNGSVVLGLAENGFKISLYTVNNFELSGGMDVETLTQFFRTFHHEFGHILNQRKPYPENFKLITGNYNTDWTIYIDEEAREMGFVSAYSISAETEDFVEILSYYVTMTQTEWSDFLGAIQSAESVNFIQLKLQSVRSYMEDSYGIDIDKLRDSIVQAIAEVSVGDLEI